MQDSLVSINIVLNNILLNKSNVPILYYWNGEENDILRNKICNEEKIKDIIKNNIKTIDDLKNGFIAFFYYKNEEYTEENICFESFIQLKDLNDNIWVELIMPHFLYLYKCAFYENYINPTNTIETLLDIYNKVHEKFINKVTPLTFINYIISKLKIKGEYITEIFEILSNLLIENGQQ